MPIQEKSGFPYFEIQFTKEGAVNDQKEAEQVLNFLAPGPVTDLFVISHGWNNDMAEARSLYDEFFFHVRNELDHNPPPGVSDRKFAILGILWPSKKFADKDLIASGAAGIESPAVEDAVQEQLDDLKGNFFDHPQADAIIEQAKQLVSQLEDDPEAQRQYADLIRSLPGRNEANAEDASEDFFELEGKTLMNNLSRPVASARPASRAVGGAADLSSSESTPQVTHTDAGGAAGLLNALSSKISAALKALNFVTYYQMKERAGVVGRLGVNQVLKQIRGQNQGLKIHLIGHSFGGRLVTSAAHASDSKLQSMTLLQAAFSHNGFANKFDDERDGFFRKVVTDGKISGPVIISHSIQDRAVGIAYPLASLFARQDSSGLGDENDPYGGIGRNGAQHMLEGEVDNSTPLGAVNVVYSFQPGRLHNLKADTIISGHSDIKRPEVAHALLSAVAKT